MIARPSSDGLVLFVIKMFTVSAIENQTKIC